LLEFSVTLPETQARILNYTVRATLGWQGSTRTERRASMTLTVGQLKRRIARTSTLAVAEGLAALVRQGIIEVTSASGMPVSLRDVASNQRLVIVILLERGWVEES
jgi:SOS-response transcriptional repressor LexA